MHLDFRVALELQCLSIKRSEMVAPKSDAEELLAR